MKELDIATLIKAKFSGQLTDTQTYVNMVIQFGGILLAMLIVWRFIHNRHMKKVAASKNRRMESTFAKNWRKD